MFGRRKPEARTYVIRPGDSLPPDVLHEFDQQQAHVREAYDRYLNQLVEIARSCECGEPVNGAQHTLAFQTQLAGNSVTALAALALEGLLRDAMTKVAEQ